MDYEFTIHILNKDYIDSLVVALARQGYAPYITEDRDYILVFRTRGKGK